MDDAAVLGKRIEYALVHLHMHQVVASEGESGGTAGTEHDAAQLSADRAAIAYRIGEQSHIASAAGIDGAVIDDAA